MAEELYVLSALVFPASYQPHSGIPLQASLDTIGLQTVVMPVQHNFSFSDCGQNLRESKSLTCSGFGSKGDIQGEKDQK